MSNEDKKQVTPLEVFVGFVIFAAIILVVQLWDSTPSGERVYNSPRFALIQLTAAKNGANTKWLAGLGFSMPEEVRKKKPSYQIFPNGVSDDYDKFVETVIDILQPESHVCSNNLANCREKRIEGASAILAASAIGKYQVLLRHHGKYIKSWKTSKWDEERMRIIYDYITTPALQDHVSICLLRKLRDENDGDPKQMASAYYSGSGTGSFFSLKNLKSYIPSMGGFGSKHKYSNNVKKCYQSRAGKSDVETDEDLVIFHKCIARKESGGAAETADETQKKRKHK